MLAPLRKPWVGLLVAFFTAPMVFRCLGSVNAHPLENDLSVSARTTLDSGSLLDVRVDSPPPPYTSDPEDESEDDEVLSEDDDSLPEDDETLPGADDDEAPPQYSFQIHSIDYVDELGGKARLNGFKSVLLEADPLELGRNDPEGLSRKYYIVDPDDPERRVVLKIIDLLKAKKLGDRFPTLLMREGWYWNQMKGNRFLWETKEPVEQQNHRGRVIKSDYMVVYRPARTGLFLGEKYADGDPRITELKFIGEWALDWQSAEVAEYMLERCKASAIKMHKRLAERKIEIKVYSLDSWVTDVDCDHWVPNQINAGFKYVSNDGLVTLGGARPLKIKGKKEMATYLQKVGKLLNRRFTPEEMSKHVDDLSQLKEEKLRAEGSG